MKKWLLISAGILVLMGVGLVYTVRTFLPSPIPEPPTIADCPLAIHINEIDLSTTGMILVSIDNLTREELRVDLSWLGTALTDDMRFFDPVGNEWAWVKTAGGRGQPLSIDSYWQLNGQWGQQDQISIEPGRSENLNVLVSDGFSLAAQDWSARLRGAPERLVYVIDCEILTVNPRSGEQASIRVTAKGEAAFKPRP